MQLFYYFLVVLCINIPVLSATPTSMNRRAKNIITMSFAMAYGLDKKDNNSQPAVKESIYNEDELLECAHNIKAAFSTHAALATKDLRNIIVDYYDDGWKELVQLDIPSLIKPLCISVACAHFSPNAPKLNIQLTNGESCAFLFLERAIVCEEKVACSRLIIAPTTIYSPYQLYKATIADHTPAERRRMLCDDRSNRIVICKNNGTLVRNALAQIKNS